MNYKNCKHYNEIVRVMSDNLSLDDINFKIEENDGCECVLEGDSVCELWVTLAFAHDMAPQVGIEHAKQTIDNLGNRMKEIATRMLSNIGNESENTNEENIDKNDAISDTDLENLPI